MTEEKLDLLLDLAMEQYDPKPGKEARVQRKILGKSFLHSEELQRTDQLFRDSFTMFSRLMQTI